MTPGDGPEVDAAGRWHVDGDETRSANRSWWDGEAEDYYAEHGAFLGDSEFVWGPEGWTEGELDLLQVRDGMTVLEIGSGGAQCSRWLARHHDVRVVASDLSMGMLRQARRIEGAGSAAGSPASGLPLLQCDGLALPLADASVDRVFTAYGVMPFVADNDAVLAEAARVLRPGGRFVFFLNHPLLQTPGSGWIDDQILDPPEQYWRVGPYLTEASTVEQVEKGVFIRFVHRPLGRYVNALARAGLVLEHMI